MRARRLVFWTACAAAGALSFGCGGGGTTVAAADAGARGPGSADAGASARVSDAGLTAADAGAGAAAMPKISAQDMDWQESERSRDPFRSFASYFADEARGKVKSQREVMLDQYPLESLKLMGIVLRADPPLAMLVDPAGKGHSVKRGQFVGRAEVVQSAGQSGAAYEVNWRLETIRDGDVVFVREDPQNPDVPSATKVIPLRPEGESEGIEG